MSRVVEAIRAFPGLTGPGVVAVSGGADSVALLRGLLDAGARPLTVAHFHHQLRGAESDADEAFVRELAASLGVPFARGSADVRAAAAGDNLEATARRLRYDWLASLGGDWVATGHTADDQAETVLHRIIRGTGLQGLRGIAVGRNVAPAVHLVRPLLIVTRAEVLDYLTELGQPFREDATNSDPAFTRNRIRHELLPLLKTFNPAVVDVLGRLARQADEAHRVIAEEATRVLTEANRPRAGNLYVLDAETMALRPDYLVREVFRTVWAALGWPMDGMTADHWQRLVGIVRGNPVSADFPGGVHVRRVGRVVQLGRRE
ncbi:MAG TPA: tRNA lysidine(34) synthetase TilS [Fimbriiglobus sp.]|nr:tRNA lysidine(34) synthetase TilS [Fimbriiglobus sp.]